MSPDDVVPLGKTPYFARRAVAEAWAAAGYPPINSATRLYSEQKKLFDGWQAGWAGYSPADNPDDTSQALAHVRGVALDITATDSRVEALSAAGLVRPYSYEPWHWQLPGDVRRFPLITAFPNTPAAPAVERSEEDTMARLIRNTDGTIFLADEYGVVDPRKLLDAGAGLSETVGALDTTLGAKQLSNREFDLVGMALTNRWQQQRKQLVADISKAVVEALGKA
ncbi:hypothetical protein [Microbacterium sp. MMO-10]|uniref:hypothetical protein n=1 Tax=Microbacterium sp. MMO-10 TaxID=3081272 RepID=UPI003015F069